MIGLLLSIIILSIGQIMMDVEKFSVAEIQLESKDPMDMFKSWFQEAMNNSRDNILPEQMSLATVSKDGGPSVRTVLLREHDHEGFKIYTDSRSRKGQEIERDTRGAISIVWISRDAQDKLSYKQVRAEGPIEKLSSSQADIYFQTEPISAKIRATVCHQSQVIVDRQVLLNESQKLLDKVKTTDYKIPKPDSYVGYRLRPVSIEFYYGSRDTINDRVRFRLDPQAHDLPQNLLPGVSLGHGSWVYERLEP